MGRRHLTPWEIKEQCKRIARESRMAYASPWTAMGIVCGYTLYKSEGFKGPRISKVITRIDELTREVRDHNNFAKRMPVVEAQMSELTRRVQNLERPSA